MTSRHIHSRTTLEMAREFLTKRTDIRVGAAMFSLVRELWIKRITERAGFEFLDSPYDLNSGEVLVVPDVWPQGLVDLGLRAFLNNLAEVRGLRRVSSQDFTQVIGELVATCGGSLRPRHRVLDL